LPNVVGMAVAITAYCLVRFVFLAEDQTHFRGGKAVLIAVLLGWAVRSWVASLSKEPDQ